MYAHYCLAVEEPLNLPQADTAKDNDTKNWYNCSVGHLGHYN